MDEAVTLETVLAEAFAKSKTVPIKAADLRRFAATLKKAQDKIVELEGENARLKRALLNSKRRPGILN